MYTKAIFVDDGFGNEVVMLYKVWFLNADDSLACEAEPRLTECERCGELTCDDDMANWQRIPEGYLCPFCTQLTAPGIDQ